MTGVERRRSPRVSLVKSLEGRTVAGQEALLVRQMSEGGMQIETEAQLSPLGLHEFRLVLPGRAAIVRGRVLHGRFRVSNGRPIYTLGIEFLDTPPETLGVIRDFIRSLA